jgi:hypothetical protein
VELLGKLVDFDQAVFADISIGYALEPTTCLESVFINPFIIGDRLAAILAVQAEKATEFTDSNKDRRTLQRLGNLMSIELSTAQP